jgi:APA family basic amino acid/polyamine antiporter
VAISAFALVELATSIPRAGGPYTFAGRAFGSSTGTLVGWVDWLNGIVAIGYFSVVFAEYLQRLGLLTTTPTGMLAVALIVAVTAINWMGTRACGVSQMIGSSLKGLGLLLLIGLLFIAPSAADVGPTFS